MKERLKNLLLAGLLLLMLALLTATFLESVRGSQGGRRLLHLEEESGQTAVVSAQAMAFPEVLALMGPEGLYVPDSGESYALLYQQSQPVYQEALGSAGPPEALAEGDYLALLEGTALLAQYHAPQPFYLLQDWSGSETLREGMEITGTALARQGESVVLLLTDREGRRWRAETAASAADLETLCTGAPEGNAVFASGGRILSGDQVLTTQALSMAGRLDTAPEMARRGELSQSVQSLFDMNAYLTRVYPNTDGSLVYVESRSTVSLSLNGDLVFSGSDGAELKLTAAEGPERRAEICQKVYDLLSRLWESAGASGKLSLEEARFEGERGVLRFALCQDGVFFQREEGDWATVVVENGAVVSLFAALRQIEETESVTLLPLTLAQAALPQGKAALRVRLLQGEGGMWTPTVCRVTED